MDVKQYQPKLESESGEFWNEALGPKYTIAFKFGSYAEEAMFDRLSKGYLDTDYANTWWNVALAIDAHDHFRRRGLDEEAEAALQPIYAPRQPFMEYLKTRFPLEEHQDFLTNHSNLNWDRVHRNEVLVSQYNEALATGAITIDTAKAIVHEARANIKNHEPQKWAAALPVREVPV